MAYIPLNIPPGVSRNGTELQSAGRWYDANLVRWVNGTLGPVRGWRRRTTTPLSGRARSTFTWRDNDGDRWLAIGTNSNLYVIKPDETVSDITPVDFDAGEADSVLAMGYGEQTYGRFAYGVARPDNGVYRPVDTWTLDTFGQFLIGCNTSDKRVLMWQLNTSVKAAAIPGAPTGNSVVSTPERFLFVLGANGNPRKVQWADQESTSVWTPAATNQAGDFELKTSGTIACGRGLRGQTLILTDLDAHTATYAGPPFVYGFERVGTGCGIIGANAIAAIDNFAVWMSTRGFFMFDGYVKPVDCAVTDYVFGDINRIQAAKTYAVNISQFHEVWWFYPSGSSTECDRYVAWNYKENHWTVGKLSRTAGTDKGVFQNPIMVGTDGHVYDHEVGYDYDGAIPFVESGPVQIANGDQVMHVTGMVPDERTQGDVKAFFRTKFYPNAEEQTFGPYNMANPTDLRFTGRQLKLRLEGAQPADWRVGVPRLDAKPGGRR